MVGCRPDTQLAELKPKSLPKKQSFSDEMVAEFSELIRT